MKLASGTIASLVLTIGALMFLVAGGSSESVSGRRPAKVSYLRSHPSRKLYNYSRNSGSSSSSSYNSDSSSSSYNGDDYTASGTSSSSSSSYSYNSNAQANGSTYNGRDQDWSGSDVQMYTDDGGYDVEVETYTEDQNATVMKKFGGLAGMETLSIIGLLLIALLSGLAIFALSNGFNIVHLFQVYCFRGAFGHSDQKTEGDTDTVEEGFVKLDDEA